MSIKTKDSDDIIKIDNKEEIIFKRNEKGQVCHTRKGICKNIVEVETIHTGKIDTQEMLEQLIINKLKQWNIIE